MRKRTLLVVEDCPAQLKTYAEYAVDLGFGVLGARSSVEALEILKESSIDILLTDIHLSPSIAIDTYEGHEVVKYAADNCPETIILAMSNDPKAATYHKTIELGAMAYIKKPILKKDEILVAIEVARERNMGKVMRDRLMRSSPMPSIRKIPTVEDGIVLDATKRKLASKLATTKGIPIIISGETGSGKEEYVKLIHKKRQEYEKTESPLVVVNCANLDSSIAVSILFGHSKGAFTGADKTTKGAIGEADGGILFLDEIHLLPIDCQMRLLRVLNDGSYERLGDPKTLRSNFQIIVAATRDLDEMVQQGSFLLDLRMRISGAEIYLDPLRARKGDIPALVELFFSKWNADVEEEELGRIIERLQSFYWQGNIRQLYKVVQTLVTMASLMEEPIKADNIPISPLMLDPNEGQGIEVNRSKGETLLEKIALPLHQDLDFYESVSFYEAAIIGGTLKRHKTVSAACQAINLPRSTFDDKKSKLLKSNP